MIRRLAAGAVMVLSAAALPPIAAATAHAAATPSGTKVCTDTQTYDNDFGRKTNIKFCAVTDGTELTMTEEADCFASWGAKQYPYCEPGGGWTLRSKDGTEVSSGRNGNPVLYRGPGTFELEGYVYAEGREAKSQKDSENGGFKLGGDFRREITLKTPTADGPRLEASADYNKDNLITLTVTNKGNKAAKDASLTVIRSPKSIFPGMTDFELTTDKRCSTEYGLDPDCNLGDLIPGASATVTLNANATDICDTWDRRSDRWLTWTIGAANHPGLDAQGPC